MGINSSTGTIPEPGAGARKMGAITAQFNNFCVIIQYKRGSGARRDAIISKFLLEFWLLLANRAHTDFISI